MKWDEMTREQILAIGLQKAACMGACEDCPRGSGNARCEELPIRDSWKVLNMFGRTSWVEGTPKDDLLQAPKQAPKSRLTREDCLEAAKIAVTGQRESDYGSPEDSFTTIAALWSAYLGEVLEDVLSLRPVDVAAMMSLLKIARIGGGNATADSFIDLAGYAACGCEIATGENK